MIDWEKVESAERQLARWRAAQRALVEVGFSSKAAVIMGAVSGIDQLMWPVQQSEALAWQKNPAAETPYLDGLAVAQGMDPEEMRSAVLERVMAQMSEIHELVAARRRLLHAVEAAQSIEELTSIVWP